MQIYNMFKSKLKYFWLWIYSWCFLLRYGKISEKVIVYYEGYGPGEIEFFASDRSIGYYAYGNYEPGSIYHGQKLLSFCFEETT